MGVGRNSRRPSLRELPKQSNSNVQPTHTLSSSRGASAQTRYAEQLEGVELV